MSPTGHTLFRTALLAEGAINLASLLQLLLVPEWTLTYLVKGPAQITPAAKSLTQIFGGVIVLTTVPLFACYPESREPADVVLAKRRLTYTAVAATEAALGAITLMQFLAGDSGMTDQALLMATGTMGALTSMRLFFLYVRPEWMEAKTRTKKTT